MLVICFLLDVALQILTFILETCESAGVLPLWHKESLDSALRRSCMVVWKVASDILRLVVNVVVYMKTKYHKLRK